MAAVPDSLEIGFRPMRDTDLAVIGAMERASYRFPWSEGIFADCLRVGYRCKVIESGGIVIGYGVMACGAGEAHLLNLCIRKDDRGRGLGTLLLKQFEQGARQAGAERIVLEVRPSNTTALRLYASNGYRQIGIRRAYYRGENGREDALVLTRELETAEPEH